MSKYASKLTSARIAAARPVATPHAAKHYTAPEPRPFDARPGSMVAHALASRMNNTLHWPSGIKTDIHGNPFKEQA